MPPHRQRGRTPDTCNRPRPEQSYLARCLSRFEVVVARRWDYDGLRLVSQQVSAAVATAENINSLADVYPLIANQAVDVVNVSALHSGVTGCRQIAHLAHAFGLPVSMMNCQANFMAQIAAALPNHLTMEVVVQTMEPERLFSFRWHPYAVDPTIDYSREPATLVEFTLQATATGTLLIVVESGFDAVPAARRAEAFRMNEGGWTEQMQNIAHHVGARD